MRERLYYGKKTGKPTKAARWVATNHLDCADELARLQRERDRSAVQLEAERFVSGERWARMVEVEVCLRAFAAHVRESDRHSFGMEHPEHEATFDSVTKEG